MIALKHKRSCRLVKLMKMTLGKRYQTCRLCLLSDALLKGLKEVLKLARLLFNIKQENTSIDGSLSRICLLDGITYKRFIIRKIEFH